MGLFQSYRNDGTLKFDDTIAPYVFREKGVVQTIDSTENNLHYSTNSPSTALIPMNRDQDELILVRMDNQYAYARYGNHSYNGNWNHIYHTSAPVGTNLTYYRYVQATQIADNLGGGLQLFNEARTRTFHSSMRPLIPVGIISGDNSQVTLNNGRRYASLCPALAGYCRITYTGQKDYLYDEKGNITAEGWTGYQSAPLRGIRWKNDYTAETTVVSFSDGTLFTISDTQPPNKTIYDIPLNNALLADVTGL